MIEIYRYWSPEKSNRIPQINQKVVINITTGGLAPPPPSPFSDHCLLQMPRSTIQSRLPQPLLDKKLTDHRRRPSASQRQCAAARHGRGTDGFGRGLVAAAVVPARGGCRCSNPRRLKIALYIVEKFDGPPATAISKPETVCSSTTRSRH